MAKILTVSRKKPSPHGLSNPVSCSKDDKHQHMIKFHKYVKCFHLTIYWQVFVLYFNPTIFHNL